MSAPVDVLFTPFHLNRLRLPNRIIMAPMTRAASPDGIPGADVAAYYRRRAEGGVGLIVTEGTWIPHPSAGFNARVPRLYGQEPLAGWQRVVDEVHAAGGLIFPQLWHVGASLMANDAPADGVVPLSPSGLGKDGAVIGRAMSQDDIDATVAAYGNAAAAAQAIGCDGLEIHAAHGYLIDQFFWEVTNRRTDAYGGGIAQRTRFACEIVREMRRQVGADFPIVLRFSQWKLQDYSARPLQSPADLEAFLTPLVNAGVDAFHCSTRRFWLSEFESSSLNLAGWTKKIAGKPTITVGSVTLSEELLSPNRSPEIGVTGIEDLVDRLSRGEFDLVAVGRALIANPGWPQLVRAGRIDRLTPYSADVLKSLQ
jgi:2,4-dienoyl-CoA reductase-like NADH-dependent reductase (Old Yellow Enzyme family)